MDISSYLARHLHDRLSRLNECQQAVRHQEVMMFNLSTLAMLAWGALKLLRNSMTLTRLDVAVCLLGYVSREVSRAALFDHAEVEPGSLRSVFHATKEAVERLRPTVESQLKEPYTWANQPGLNDVQRAASVLSSKLTTMKALAMNNFKPSARYEPVIHNGWLLYFGVLSPASLERRC